MMVNPPTQTQRLIPPLENGDRLTRYEFERRYHAMSHMKKAELIEGVVYVAAALRFRSRGQPHEYIVWQVFDQKVDWFYLQEGEYVPLAIEADGVMRSRVFPGLWLAVEDLLAGNMVRVLAVLQMGLGTAEHGAFVQQLAQVSQGWFG